MKMGLNKPSHVQILRGKRADGSLTKRVLFAILPYVPTSLPTLVFCRLTELTISLEGNQPLNYQLWEEMVEERNELMDVSNDIKIIGKKTLFNQNRLLDEIYSSVRDCVGGLR